MQQSEMARQMRWLMILRVVTITTLLISAFAIELLIRPAQSLRPLFLLSAVAYGMVLLYAALDRWLSGRPELLFAQLVGDAAVVTGFVGITGGLDSPMSFLYLLPIAVGSLLRYRQGGIIMAGVSWAMYTALATVGSGGMFLGQLIPAPAEVQAPRLFYYLVVHLVAFLAVALLSSSLAERLRVQGNELIERRGAVARLQALNENIIESINSGLITTDLSGTVNFMNRGGSDITGFVQTEVDGMSVEDLLSLEHGYLSEVRRQLLANRRFRFEQYYVTKKGSRIYLGIAASNLYDRAGHPLGFIFIFQDLTEIQALEQEVRLSERMAALGEMAAGMAHELRNPLAAISGSVQFLKGDLRLDGETRELMDIILRESTRLDQVIRDFLTFARPGKFTPEPADLVKLLDDSIKLLSKSREFRPEHRIETRYASNAVVASVDANRMKQVFWNLAINALKAMPDGGVLSIEVAETPDRRSIQISFADQGRGMSEAEVEKYFQPFQGSFGDGTGLGAAIVFRLVEEHRGRIHIDSTPDAGTRVRIDLPREGVGREAAPESPAASVAGGARR